jgi:hypothetical protein
MPGSRASFESLFAVREKLRPLPAPRVPRASLVENPLSLPLKDASASCRRSTEQGDDTPLAAGAVDADVREECPDTVVGCLRHPAFVGYRSRLSISRRSMNSYAMAKIF